MIRASTVLSQSCCAVRAEGGLHNCFLLSNRFIQGIIECITEEDIANNVTACMFESWITSSSNLRGQPSQTGVMALGLSVQEFRKLLE